MALHKKSKIDEIEVLLIYAHNSLAIDTRNDLYI